VLFFTCAAVFLLLQRIVFVFDAVKNNVKEIILVEYLYWMRRVWVSLHGLTINVFIMKIEKFIKIDLTATGNNFHSITE